MGRFLFFFVLLTLCLTSVKAETDTLNAIDDACVYSGSPSTNYGSNSALVVGESSGDWETYIKWDISSLASATITSADMRLYKTHGDTSMNVLFGKVGASWSENTINWNNKPTSLIWSLDAHNVTGYYGWAIFEIAELTSYLQSLVESGANEISLSVHG